MHKRQALALMTCTLAATTTLAHEGGGDGEHLNVGFYYGHDGTFENPKPQPDPPTLLVDTHPWELDSVFYSLLPSTTFDEWSTEFPGYRTLAIDDQESGGHGYFTWLDNNHGIGGTPDLQLHIVSKHDDLNIFDPFDQGTPLLEGATHSIGVDTQNHHLIYTVEYASGLQVGDVVTAEFYLSDANGFIEDSQVYELQFEIVPEPTSAVLLGLGGLMMMRRRR